jgi:hypothetical protein
MSMQNKTVTRVLAIDPYSQGVGFAVLEGDGQAIALIDSGMRTTRTADNRKAARAIKVLIDQYRPDILALENWAATGSRRCHRVDLLLNGIASSYDRHLRVRLVSKRQVCAIGPLPHTATKHGRARLVADRFPELEAFLPPVRKIWQPEDCRMSIFDAVSFALACFLPEEAPETDPQEKMRTDHGRKRKRPP